MLKAVGIVRFLSIVLFLLILALVYAYLPLMILINPEDTLFKVHRETFFYTTSAFFLLVNIISWVVLKLIFDRLERQPDLIKAWIKAFSPVLNIGITLLVGFVGVINNPTHVSVSAYGYLNFLGPLLFVAWVIGIVYLMLTRKKIIA